MGSFYLNNGMKADNLKELVHMLNSMSDGDFQNHVNEHKNDFSEWIKHSLNNPVLAEKVRLIRSRHDFAAMIRQELNPPAQVAPVKSSPVQATPVQTKPKPVVQNSAPVHEPVQTNHQTHISTHKKSSRKKVGGFDIKDFVYGSLFGLVIGIILTLIFS